MTNRNQNNEQGVALILTLFLMMALSVIGASLMLLSQTETYSSLNYRLMSQARYGAESGIQKTVNYLLNGYTAPVLGGAGDDLANYNMNCSPVVRAGQPCTALPIVLSADATVTSNYPVPAVQTAFHDAIGGTLTAGATSSAVTYTTSAMLLSMRRVNVFGGGVKTIQTWQITSDGSVTATRTATVELTSVMETPVMPATMYGAFGTSPTCGAMQFRGTSNVDSYDSGAALGAGGNPVISASGGNVGTNGNMTESGNATINGTLSTPRVGIGACSDGNVDALSSSGSAAICPDPNLACSSGVQPGGVIQLPAAVSMPAPPAPTTPPVTTTLNINSDTIIPDGAAPLGNIRVTGSTTLTLGSAACTSVTPCTITVNSLQVASQVTIKIVGTVILNVAGVDQTDPIDITGNGVTNTGFNPANFQIEYAGTGTLHLGGGADTTAMVYAPNAPIEINGNHGFYGAIVGSTVINNGNADIHYDRHLSGEFFLVGNGMMSAFSWKKY
jgi:Tfp pilus assembly protein PilX